MDTWTVTYAGAELVIEDEDAERLFNLIESGGAARPAIFSYRCDVSGFPHQIESIVIGPGIAMTFTKNVD